MKPEYNKMSRLKLINECTLKDGIINELETANADLDDEVVEFQNRIHALEMEMNK